MEKETKNSQIFKINNQFSVDFFVPKGLNYNPNIGDFGFDVVAKFGENYLLLSHKKVIDKILIRNAYEENKICFYI